MGCWPPCGGAHEMAQQAHISTDAVRIERPKHHVPGRRQRQVLRIKTGASARFISASSPEKRAAHPMASAARAAAGSTLAAPAPSAARRATDQRRTHALRQRQRSAVSAPTGADSAVWARWQEPGQASGPRQALASRRRLCRPAARRPGCGRRPAPPPAAPRAGAGTACPPALPRPRQLALSGSGWSAPGVKACQRLGLAGKAQRGLRPALLRA